MLRRCPHCQQNKDRDRDFGVNNSRPDHKAIHCKTCTNTRAKERRNGGPCAWRDRRRRQGALWSNEAPAELAAPVKRPQRRDARQKPELSIELARDLILQAIDQAHGRASQRELFDYIRPRVAAMDKPAQVLDRIGEGLGELFANKTIATRGTDEGRVYFRRAA